MDRSLKSRPSRHHKSSSKKHRKHRHEKIPQAPPPPEKGLDDVLDEEIKKPRVNKGEVVPPPIVGESESQPAPALAPKAEVPSSGSSEKEAESPESEPEADDSEEDEEEEQDVVKASDVLDTVEDKGSKKRRNGGGDYGAAYHELYTQLCTRMVNRIYRFFKGLYRKVDGRESKFKKKLESIQVWNQTEIDKRAQEILSVHADTEAYFKYAYAANVMLMSVVVQQDEDSEDIEIEVPKFSDFIQKSYVESARVLYDNAGVLSSDLTDYEKMRIREELFSAFGKAVATALRMMVPLDVIAPQAVGKTSKSAALENDDFSDATSEEEDSGSEEESELESDSESESGSEDYSGSESGSGSGSDSGSGSEDYSDYSDEESEEEVPRGSKKKVRVSKKSMNKPDKLNIDGY